MTEPLIAEKSDIATLATELREMADRMEANGASYFGGCFVVVPPQGADVVNTLILDKAQDPAQFWSILKTKCDMALMGLDEQQRNTSAFGRR